MSQHKKASTGRLGGKLMLSGALILGSGAYAWWEHEPDAMPAAQMAAVPRQPAATENPRPPSPPLFTPQPTPQAEETTAPMPMRRSGDEAPAQNTGPQTLAPGTASNVPLPAPGAPLDTRPAIPVYNAPRSALTGQNAGHYKDGDYTGQEADAVWGLVQVKVGIRGGAIATIECVEYPDHRNRSIEINGWALPVLAQEVVAAQSAEIDIVTQATTTSVGYRQSLATALAQARS